MISLLISTLEKIIVWLKSLLPPIEPPPVEPPEEYFFSDKLPMKEWVKELSGLKVGYVHTNKEAFIKIAKDWEELSMTPAGFPEHPDSAPWIKVNSNRWLMVVGKPADSDYHFGDFPRPKQTDGGGAHFQLMGEQFVKGILLKDVIDSPCFIDVRDIDMTLDYRGENLSFHPIYISE